MNWRSRKGKSGFIHMLMEEHGLSKRKAEKAVNSIFDAMKRALARGEPVELPIGMAWVESAPPRRQKRKFQTFRNIQDGKKSYQLFGYPKREIRFRPDPQLIEPPPKPKRVPKPGRKPRKPRPPKPPPTPFDRICTLHRQLVGGYPDDKDVELMLALSGNSKERLLQRLRSYAAQGRRFPSTRHLTAALGRWQQIAGGT
jgi:nucleoid DNA-binding protein